MLTLWSKLEGWVIAFFGVLIAIGAAILYGRSKGKTEVQNQVKADTAVQQINTANAIIERSEVRKNVEQVTAKLPQSPVVKPTVPAPVSVPGSSADKLRNEWSRD